MALQSPVAFKWRPLRNHNPFIACLKQKKARFCLWKEVRNQVKVKAPNKRIREKSGDEKINASCTFSRIILIFSFSFLLLCPIQNNILKCGGGEVALPWWMNIQTVPGLSSNLQTHDTHQCVFFLCFLSLLPLSAAGVGGKELLKCV